MLKPFVQSAAMQMLFCSYPYEAQRRITRLLLGLLPEVQPSDFDDYGEHEDFDADQQDIARKVEKRQLWTVFEPDHITLRRPYLVFVFIEMMQYRWRGLQAIETAKELLMHLTPAELQLAFCIDRQLIEYVKNTEDWLRLESESEDPNLVTYINGLVNRIKKEAPSADFKVNQLARMTTKARTVRGSVMPHDVIDLHPAQKDAQSDLSLSEEEELDMKAENPRQEPDLEISD